MKNKILIKIYFCLLSVILFVSCFPKNIQFHSDSLENLNPENSETCISPSEEFAYQIHPQDDKPFLTQVLPSNPWFVETPLYDETRYSKLLATRLYDDQAELWILTQLTASQSQKSAYEFTIYYPELKNWKIIPAEIENSGIYIGDLFIMPDGEIFGQPQFDQANGSAGMGVISKYNPETEQFEFVEEIYIPEDLINKGYASSKIIYDSQRMIFWVFFPHSSIYSYNPKTNEYLKHVPINEPDNFWIISEPVLSSDGGLYFLTGESTILTNENIRLFRFDINTGQIKKIVISFEPWPPVSTIFADQMGRLWFGAVGWYEPQENTWYQMIRSPIFITNILWSGLDYRWKSPHVVLESSDNRIWFQSDENGLVWLDPDEEQWCWFTTLKSNIVEDAEGNLWMLADGKIYKNPLGEK